jgi:GalNAc-alpha-(1->4)-GalNAc-alpha-(1->3)-diNAcBac-PP-undecaprenol alpha-1,4-N-acetyl-D-galactosaminyltransferase
LLVIASLEGGGAERQISDMANYWAGKGWTVILATWSGLEVADFYPLDARVMRVSFANPANAAGRQSRIRVNLNRVAQLRRYLKVARPEVVLSFMCESNLLAILAGARLDLRVAVSERVQPAYHTDFPWTWRIFRRILYRWADEVIAQTQDAAQWLTRHCAAHVTVIPNALRALPEPSREKQRLIVAVGRLTHQKGFDILLRAFARISAEFKDWRVAIIGEGAERDNLMRLREELMLADRVDFVGQIPDVLDWMDHAGMVVQPSRFEGFPNVVLESMGLGTVVVSADCPSGPADLIQDGVNGRLVPVDDADALARVMADLISRPDERARLGRAATGVRERYRQDVVMGRWEECLFRGPAHAGPQNARGVSEAK